MNQKKTCRSCVCIHSFIRSFVHWFMWTHVHYISSARISRIEYFPFLMRSILLSFVVDGDWPGSSYSNRMGNFSLFLLILTHQYRMRMQMKLANKSEFPKIPKKQYWKKKLISESVELWFANKHDEQIFR